MPSTHRLLALTCFALLSGPLASAQTTSPATGFPQWGTFNGDAIDTVNVGNLNVHFEFPIFAKKGIGLDFYAHLLHDNTAVQISTIGVNSAWIEQTAAAQAAEITNLAAKALSNVGNQTAQVGSKEVAGADAKEFLGPGAEQITDRVTGAFRGWKSADGSRIVIDTHADLVGEHMNLINKTTGGNLHVRW